MQVPLGLMRFVHTAHDFKIDGSPLVTHSDSHTVPRMTLGSDDVGHITQTSGCVDAVQMSAASLELCRRNPSASWTCPPSNLGRQWSTRPKQA
ncbi:60S ribosomal protein L24a [Aspergillus luchuensis]|uniref:60S ribosomal protein L24a n=1 Tax=Aspergillus kawachii TaxID=1069201 RepID=A0A146FSH6_ASPKA|nr:60S ribosomal protein L24a [Aspergillus luchuensis]